MNKDSIDDPSANPTQELSIKIPPRLAERVKVYAQETDNSIEGGGIEALDVFLRERKNRQD